jgi:2-polyprenyl-3-methyl-5-hydroxy-6-metoxy-1,4-benzoquinol methylase
MTREEYKIKLREFNSTEKYKSELILLVDLLHCTPNKKILDYGCGLGTAVRYINENTQSNCFGYDVRNCRETDDPYLFRNEYFFKFQSVFFMHSIAHIPDVAQKLQELKMLLSIGANIYVITPNKHWLREINGKEYVPDPTVINHFSSIELQNLFIDNGFKIDLSGQFGSILNNQHERLFLKASYE